MFVLVKAFLFVFLTGSLFFESRSYASGVRIYRAKPCELTLIGRSNLESANESRHLEGFPARLPASPVFSKRELSRIRKLFDSYDMGLRRDSADDYYPSMAQLPYFTLKVRLTETRRAEILSIKPNVREEPFKNKRLPKRLAQAMVDAVLERAREQFPEHHADFIRPQGFYVDISFIRYLLPYGERTAGVHWHNDGLSDVQTIIPIRIPRNLKGGRIFIEERPYDPKGNRVLAIEPRTNRMILFLGNEESWHKVEDFRVEGVSSGNAIRDVLGVSFSTSYSEGQYR
ncbi:MAG: hypothetical protein AB1540_08785 [Bdellovibrionota bacterium]